MLRGVVDTNVLVSALVARRGVCGQLLDAGGLDGRWRLVVSPLLLVELEGVLGRKKFSRIAIAEIEQFVAAVQRHAEVVPDAPQPWPQVTRDPADDYLVALAQSAGADALVSGDLDLTELSNLSPPVMRPSDFLARVEVDGRGRVQPPDVPSI